MKTKKNNCLIRQEYSNSSKPITVVPGSKKYVKQTNKQTNKTVLKLYKTIKKDNENRQKHYVKHYNIKPSLKEDLHCDFQTVHRQNSPSVMSKKYSTSDIGTKKKPHREANC